MIRVLIVSLLFLFSCSRQGVESESTISAVSLDLTNERTDKVDLELKSNIGAYGPDTENVQYLNQARSKKSISVIITPSLYMSLVGVDTLKCFEMNDIKINLVAGVGFASVLAALYAEGNSPEEIRWKIFNKIRSENLEPFTKEWFKSWENFLDKHINENKIKSSNITLWLPKKNDRTINYQTSRTIVKDVKNNINANSSEFVLDENFFTAEELKKFPTDNVIIINTLPKVLNFKQPTEFLIGQYGKIYSFLYREEIANEKIKVININSTGAIDDPLTRLEINQLKAYCSQVLKVLD
ncbi:hypothetical protein [Bacteriovorax sp. Seq25_V]|uniref:hypothetical protein n=1 Tax=Bacteriovorax sp. Seq25_V TaxID=1201288 RepID=UPI00038A08B9|nr:hypothetical protein [Bacteriovorax sp. Seq25_V]EQC43356.1 hypothetical protein M900_2733 [Bacteriovorax sp. Seq25_V]